MGEIRYLFVLSLICFNHCLINSYPNQEISNINNEVKTLVNSEEKFALNLLKQLSLEQSNRKDSEENFIISPYTVWSLLLVIAEGADGKTLEQIRETLQLPENATSLRNDYNKLYEGFNSLNFTSFQAVFPDRKYIVQLAYSDIIKNTYKVKILPVDFQMKTLAKNTINGFVSKATNETIKNAVSISDLENAAMVMLSTIYFKGLWTIPFIKELPLPFYNENDEKITDAKIMYADDYYFYGNISDLFSQVIELPYGQDKRLSMLIILPYNGIKLTIVTKILSNYNLSKLFSQLNEEAIEVILPLFMTSTSSSLNQILQDMGIQDLFDSSKSNLSKLSENKESSFLSRLFHITKIEVNEIGTTASSITGGLIKDKIGSNKLTFYANRPFAYMIVDKMNNLILFCGVIRNPSKL